MLFRVLEALSAMKEKSSLPTIGIAVGILALGFGLGLVFGKAGSDSSSEETTIQKISTVSSRAVSPRNVSQEDKAEQSLSEIFARSGQGARVEGLVSYFQNLTVEELIAEAGKLQNLSRSERIIASHLLFSRWGELNPTAALDFSKTMGFGGRFVRPTILQSWAANDPQSAASHYKENSAELADRGWGRRGGRGGESATSIAGEWAKTDPESALAWAATLTGRERTEAESGIYRQLASEDPAAAAQKLAASANPQHEDALREIARQWGDQNLAEAESWARSLSGDAQTVALARVIETLAKTDLASAKTKALSLTDGGDKDRAISSVVSQMSQTSPEQAMSYLMENGSPDAQRNSISDTMRNWMGQDTFAAAEFLGGLEDGGVRDRAVATYVSDVKGTDPQETVNLAMSIGDNRLRDRSTSRAAAEWMKADPTAATEFIENTDAISDRRKRRLLDN